ncbi:hypothetical protein B566_EDAN015270 [Ephemera danica]|nr:hypothetical protein B566_EDAN015270 [Ephemera danica]
MCVKQLSCSSVHSDVPFSSSWQTCVQSFDWRASCMADFSSRVECVTYTAVSLRHTFQHLQMMDSQPQNCSHGSSSLERPDEETSFRFEGTALTAQSLEALIRGTKTPAVVDQSWTSSLATPLEAGGLRFLVDGTRLCKPLLGVLTMVSKGKGFNSGPGTGSTVSSGSGRFWGRSSSLQDVSIARSRLSVLGNSGAFRSDSDSEAISL